MGIYPSGPLVPAQFVDLSLQSGTDFAGASIHGDRGEGAGQGAPVKRVPFRDQGDSWIAVSIRARFQIDLAAFQFAEKLLREYGVGANRPRQLDSCISQEFSDGLFFNVLFNLL